MTASTDIRLRAAEPEDLELAYKLENDISLWQYGCASAPYSRYTLRQYLEQNTADIFADKQVRLTIDIRQDISLNPQLCSAASPCEDPATLGPQWMPVGFVDLFNFEPLHNRAELGMALLPRFEGQGFGHRALGLLLDYVKAIHLHTLYAIISADNKKASRIFELAGFTPSALLCDWLYDGTAYHDARVWMLTICRDHCDLRESHP